MSRPLAEQLTRLSPDSVRETIDFSPEFKKAQESLFAASDPEVETLLADWLSKYQPCLFGRIAAKRGQLSYCILREADLEQGNEHVRQKIQQARSRWTAEGFRGRKSGFIVYLLSNKIASSRPDLEMLEFARTLGGLYLLEELEADRIYLDELFLEAPTTPPATWRWAAGVNYFSSHGDGRWWHDHRIPAGMAFSVNSVGHMAKSGRLMESIAELAKELEIDDLDQASDAKVTTLLKALELAMMTIDRAATTSSGKATQLLQLPDDSRELPVFPCPTQLPKALGDKDYCRYAGYYHTDVTLPAEYFIADVDRPASASSIPLDFTYLFDDSLDNPDYIRMGKGLRIRDTDSNASQRLLKRRKSLHETVPLSQSARLSNALRDFPQ